MRGSIARLHAFSPWNQPVVWVAHPARKHLFCLFTTIAFVPRSPAQSNSSGTTHQVFRIVYHHEKTIPLAMDAPIFKNIYAVNTNGSAEEKLTEDNHSFGPVLSPDGSRIAYIHITPETCEGCLLPAKYELYVMNADGTDPHFVTPLDGPLPFLRWSPDGKSVAYGGGFAKRDSQPPAFAKSPLYLAKLDGTSAPFLLSQEVVGTFEWSPDGKWIAHGCPAQQTPSPIRVRLCLSKVGEQGNSTVFSEESPLSGFSWSPDSTSVAFVYLTKNNQSILIAGTNGSPTRALANVRAMFTKPCWSPDGQKILFEDIENDKAAIFIINSDGSNRQRLTEPKLKASNAMWSPDGKQIAFRALVHGRPQIYLMNADGSEIRQITHEKKMQNSGFLWLAKNTLLLFSSSYLEPVLLLALKPINQNLSVLDLDEPTGHPLPLAQNVPSALSIAPFASTATAASGHP
jgi:dipeptidyl aminopeptidase/acylaminoacyl peptidase